MDTAERYKAARERFFAENPIIAASCEQVDAAVIEACGITVESHREQQRIQAFASAAQGRGIDVSEFVIQLMAVSPQQAHKWRIENYKRRAATVGIDWEQFKRLNGITE